MARDITQKRTKSRTNRALIELRLDAGLTPNDLGRRAHVSGNTVRSAEAGNYVDPRSQKAIAHALSMKVLDVFPFELQREARRR